MRKTLAAAALFGIGVCAWAAQVKSRGRADAPILLEIYSDYHCPGCKALYETTLQPLIQNYADKGKVYIIHHEFPLPMHPDAMQAAYYACAANRVGKWERVCDVLFRQQQNWSANGKVDETVCSVLMPEEAKKVRALAKDPSIVAEVQQDIQAGQAAHVDGTPFVVLTHRLKQYRIPGTASYDLLHRFIDQLLAN